MSYERSINQKTAKTTILPLIGCASVGTEKIRLTSYRKQIRITVNIILTQAVNNLIHRQSEQYQ